MAKTFLSVTALLLLVSLGNGEISHAQEKPPTQGTQSTETTMELVFKGLAAAGAAIAWLYQTRATLVRGKIKADLEILEKYRSLVGEDEHSRRITFHIQRLTTYVYRQTGVGAVRRVSWSDLTFGLAFLTSATLWNIYVVIKDLNTSWLLVTVLLAFVGLGGVLNAFPTKGRKVSAAEPSLPPDGRLRRPRGEA